MCDFQENVRGENCDACHPGHYNLRAENPMGCDPCFCFSVASDCHSSTWGRHTVRSSSQSVQSSPSPSSSTYQASLPTWSRCRTHIPMWDMYRAHMSPIFCPWQGIWLSNLQLQSKRLWHHSNNTQASKAEWLLGSEIQGWIWSRANRKVCERRGTASVWMK